MAHLTRHDPWGTTDLDCSRGHVFVRQDWRYEWTARPGVAPWNEDERRSYHRAVDHLVWGHWSFRARIFVAAATPGPGQLARELIDRHQAHGLTLSFDVRRVSGGAQWLARVTKVDPRAKPLPQAAVWFESKRIELFSGDIVPHVASRYRGDEVQRPNFSVAAHEFGHTLGYVYSRGDGEEYNLGIPSSTTCRAS